MSAFWFGAKSRFWFGTVLFWLAVTPLLFSVQCQAATRVKVGSPVPDLCFHDGAGEQVCLAEWRGRVVLLSLWASWCAPCRAEMTDLDRVQATFASDKFEVVALSLDRAGIPAVANFYIRNNIRNLMIYVDPDMQAVDTLGAYGIPTALLIDTRGEVVMRIAGPVNWTADDHLSAIRRLLNE